MALPQRRATTKAALPRPPRPPIPRRRARIGTAVSTSHDPGRIQHELREMQETNDLKQVDDDVEALATLFEWQAQEHLHQPKGKRWFMALAIAGAVLVAFFIFTVNIIAAITTALVTWLMYTIAQREPGIARYRLMVDGVAIGNTLYHYRDLATFNIVYEPAETTIVLIRSKHRFAPLLTMELGDAHPVEVRDILLEFLPEDQDLSEPITDIIARQLGF